MAWRGQRIWHPQGMVGTGSRSALTMCCSLLFAALLHLSLRLTPGRKCRNRSRRWLAGQGYRHTVLQAPTDTIRVLPRLGRIAVVVAQVVGSDKTCSPWGIRGEARPLPLHHHTV